MAVRSTLIAVAAICALAGCASKPDPTLEASASYQTGYADGCTTAGARSKMFDRTIVRNEESFNKDEMYHRGWNAGYRGCGSPATQSDPYSEPTQPYQKKGGPLG
jgi:hypothetical protein